VLGGAEITGDLTSTPNQTFTLDRQPDPHGDDWRIEAAHRQPGRIDPRHHDQ
jgi:hypothetical protein